MWPMGMDIVSKDCYLGTQPLPTPIAKSLPSCELPSPPVAVNFAVLFGFHMGDNKKFYVR